MSFVNFKTAIKPINFIVLVTFIVTAWGVVANAWEIDLSRRQMDFDKVKDMSRLPASIATEESLSVTEKLFSMAEPEQDVVILNTEKGFVPQTLRLKKGGNYKVHIVNVHKMEKSLSFVLDAFSENHSTLFGEERSFTLTPKTDGIFSYQCPETAIQGKIIVFSDTRKPASQ